MSKMQGHLETVKDGVLPPDEQTVDTIYQQVRHVVKLVDGLRLLVLADAGVIHPDRQSSSIEDLLSQAAEAFRPTGEFKSVSLDTQLLGRLPLVTIHPLRWSPICWITLYFTLRRAEVVTTSAQEINEAVLVDTGSGIPPNNLDLLFDRFYRTDPSRARTTGGSGLGLTIAKQPIEALGGSISVESKPNEGSHFFFVLPLGDKELQS